MLWRLRPRRFVIAIRGATSPARSIASSSRLRMCKSVWMGKGEHLIIFSQKGCGEPLNTRKSTYTTIDHQKRRDNNYETICSFIITSASTKHWTIAHLRLSTLRPNHRDSMRGQCPPTFVVV